MKVNDDLLPGLFAPPPAPPPYPPRARARNTDPGTSHAAARSVERSGAARRHEDLILQAIGSHPEGLSARQIAAIAALTQIQVCRRLSELVADGALVRIERRDSPRRENGLPVCIWQPARR